MTVPDHSRRWLKLALIASVALNLVIVGAGVTRYFMPGPPDRMVMGSQMQLFPRKFFSELEKPRRVELLRVFRGYDPAFREGRPPAPPTPPACEYCHSTACLGPLCRMGCCDACKELWRLCLCWDTGCGPCGDAKAARLPECQCCQCVCRRCGSGWVDCYLYDCPAAVCTECGHRESACTCSVGFIPPEPACTRCGLPPPFECICCRGCSRLLEECEGLADCWEEGEDDYNDYDGDSDYY